MPKHDPRLKNMEELSATFVCGPEIENDIMAALEPRKGEELSHQSWIVTGPRGAGKTHLLTHLYHRIKEDEKFSKAWLPVSLPEEIMGGGNLLLFLKTLTGFLGKELKKEIKDYAALTNEIETLQGEKNHGSRKEQETRKARLEREYFGLWREIRKKTGRKIIFLLENIQDVMVYKLKKPDLQKLRAFMHEDPECMIIIGTALNVFGEISLPEEPFYNFFRLRSLEALGPESMMEFLEREMRRRGHPDLVEKIRESRGEVHAYRLLTGGNPRLALVLADILEETERLEISDIIRKVTELTPYFKHETDSLTNIKQSILEALCSDLPAMTVKEIAAHVGESPQAIQENLKHLLREGKVKIMDLEPGGGVKGSETFYAVSDYFYRIWLQVRQGMVGQDHTEWLAELFAFVYEEGRTVSEQTRAVYDRAKEKMSRPEYAARIETLKAFYAREEKAEKTWGAEVEEAMEVVFREDASLDAMNKALKIIEKELRENPKHVRLLNARGVGLARTGHFEEAIDAFICYILILAPLFRSVDILAAEVFRKATREGSSVDKEIAAFSDATLAPEARFHAAIRLLYLDRFDGIEALFDPLFKDLGKNADIQKLALFHFHFETIRRIRDGNSAAAVAGRYWLRSAQNLQALGMGEMRKMVMLFILHLLIISGEEVSLEALEELFRQWEKEGVEAPDMAPLFIRAVKNPESREAKVWTADPLFAELLKLLEEERQASFGVYPLLR